MFECITKAKIGFVWCGIFDTDVKKFGPIRKQGRAICLI